MVPSWYRKLEREEYRETWLRRYRRWLIACLVGLMLSTLILFAVGILLFPDRPSAIVLCGVIIMPFLGGTIWNAGALLYNWFGDIKPKPRKRKRGEYKV